MASLGYKGIGGGTNLLQQWFDHRQTLESGLRDKIKAIARKALIDLAIEAAARGSGNTEQGLIPQTQTRPFRGGDELEQLDVEATLDAINLCLDPTDPKPLICVSTQLIEAGVDLDFGCAIRSLAGLDSIAQAGGRCNRNGRSDTGPVLIVNLAEEDLRWLPEIRQAQACTETVLDDFKSSPGNLDHDLLSTAAMRHFYTHYFFRRAHDMVYPLKAGVGPVPIAADTSIFDLLSTNEVGSESYARSLKADEKPLPLRQALSTAAQAFRVIDAPTQGIVVPYGLKGRAIIGELAAAFTSEDVPLDQQIVLLRRAQQYTVNVFPGMLKKLTEVGAVREVQPESGIYYLDDRHYHDELGVTHEALSELPLNQA
jgi:CRISPR-associated endonuclease/helicase Cas3